jgi:hypothetical protein
MQSLDGFRLRIQGYQLKAGQPVQQGFRLLVYEVGATAILARQSVS